MGAADDIKKGLTKNLASFTKQRKAEEKHVSAIRWRTSRVMEVRGKYLTEAADEVMEECYMKASDNNRLPATARQIFYVARPLIEEQTDKPLSYAYFSQTLLPNFVNEHGANWDVVYDDRGHFTEPHTNCVIGLGTLNVRAYLSHVGPLNLKDADFASASVQTHGPRGCFGAVLYVEKEGFMPLFERVNLSQALRHRHHVVEGNVGHCGARVGQRHMPRHSVAGAARFRCSRDHHQRYSGK